MKRENSNVKKIYVKIINSMMLVLLVGSLVPVTSIASVFEDVSTKSTYDEKIISESEINSRANERVFANHFVLGVEEVASITDAKLKELSSVIARDADTNQPIDVTTVNHQIEAIPGRYEVAFSTDKPTTVKVFATVYGKKVENSSPAFNEFIAANNFHIGLEEVKDLTDQKLKDYSQVIAEDYDTWNNLTPVVTVIANEILPEQGDYKVSLATPNGTKIDVIATVYNESVFDPAKNERISANNFEIYLSEVASLNVDKLILLADARAFNYNNFENVPVDILNSNIVEGIGTYNVTYISENGVEVTVKVTVKANPISFYEVSYESNGGTAVNPEMVVSNGLVTKPNNPTRAGYTFAGWYKDSGLTNEWNFTLDKMPANNVKLYAKWSVNRTDVPVTPEGGTDNTLESTGLETNLVAMTSIVMMLIMLVATRVFLKRK